MRCRVSMSKLGGTRRARSAAVPTIRLSLIDKAGTLLPLDMLARRRPRVQSMQGNKPSETKSPSSFSAKLVSGLPLPTRRHFYRRKQPTQVCGGSPQTTVSPHTHLTYLHAVRMYVVHCTSLPSLHAHPLRWTAADGETYALDARWRRRGALLLRMLACWAAQLGFRKKLELNGHARGTALHRIQRYLIDKTG